MVSDRMISEIRSGKPRNLNTVKNVLYYNDMVFGYTGYSQLIGPKGQWVDTPLWMLNVLAQVGERSVPKAVDKLREAADDSFARLRRLHPKLPVERQAFVGIGWERDQYNFKVVRCTTEAIVSNYHRVVEQQPDDCCPTRIVAGESYEGFGVGWNRLDVQDNTITVNWVGTAPHSDDLARMGGEIRQACERKGIFPMDFITPLKECIRRTSRRRNHKYVGSDILAAVIQRDAPVSDHVAAQWAQVNGGIIFSNLAAGDPRLDNLSGAEMSFFYRFSTGRSDGRFVAPCIIAPGFNNLMCWNGGKSLIETALNYARINNQPAVVLGLKTHEKRRGARDRGRRRTR
jgi:hypothetical protein